MEKENLTAYLADMDQLAWARESELTSGAGRGNRIIDVDNGSGLRFTVSPDKGMNIVEASFRGVPLVFRTPGGNRSRMEYDSNGIQWLRAWQGGLMTTCGLRSTGAPNGDFGLHGRIDNLPAEDVGITRGWIGNNYEMKITGTIREAMLFGENLRLSRTISTGYKKNVIDVEDSVTNLGAETDYVLIVYHCNFGYPFVSPDLQFDLPPHEITPRDENARKDRENWNKMPSPDASLPPEECFFHDLPARDDGFSYFTVKNPKEGIKMAVGCRKDTLPRIVQWKLFQKKRYVLGIEPTNTFLNGRATELQDGTATPLPPGKSISFHVRFTFDTIQ